MSKNTEVELWDIAEVYVPFMERKYEAVLNHFYEGEDDEVIKYDIQVGDKCRFVVARDLIVEGEVVNRKSISSKEAKKNAENLQVLYLLSNSTNAVIRFNETLAEHIFTDEYLWLMLKTEDGRYYGCTVEPKEFRKHNVIGEGDKLRFRNERGIEVVGEVIAGYKNSDKQFVRRDECFWAKPL